VADLHPGVVAHMSAGSRVPPDKEKTTALIMGGTGIPTPDDFYKSLLPTIVRRVLERSG
jgi:hypothetical protein